MHIKKAWRQRHAFFYACLLLIATQTNSAAGADALSPICTKADTTAQNLEQVRLQRVKDGDSFTLRDGREIRLIGINTPELYKKSRAKPEPLAQSAKATLNALLSNDLFIEIGQQAKDRYGRTLAYAFDANGNSIEAQLLQQGLGFLVAFAPNLKQQKCFKYMQNLAKAQQRGVWQDKYFNPIKSQKVTNHNTGFTRITGTVTDISFGKSSWWLQLDEHISLKISARDQQFFQPKQLNALKYKKITVNGWLTLRKGKNVQRYPPYILLLRHSSQIE